MVRFAADVDSPPAKQPIAKLKDTSLEAIKSLKPPKRRWRSSWTTKDKTPDLKDIADRPGDPSSELKKAITRNRSWIKKEKPTTAVFTSKFEDIRKFNVDKIHKPVNKKSLTRCSIEMTLLLAIAVALGYYGVKDLSFASKCDTHLPEQLQKQLRIDLEAQIFRQEIAIQNITLLLKSHTGLTTMSFVGGCGTGKSYVASEMVKHFTERDSHAYKWGEAEHGSHHLHHLAALQELILELPSCRAQLLIIDNLSWGQKPYVEDISRWLKSNSRLREKNLVLIYIFNLQKYREEEEAEEEEERFVGELEKTNIVFFKPFLERDATDYLVQLRERANGEIQLDVDHLQTIVANANVKQYGLKRLVNKLQTIE